MATLAERVYEADSNELGPWMGLIGVQELPEDAISDDPGVLGDSPESQRGELSRMLQWAFRYGVAYSTLRHDDPLIGEERAQEEARAAATKATRWHNTVGGKPEGES
jgi:hypothetical protein